MSNQSIKSAFERLWHHVTLALNDKSNLDHTHSDFYSKNDKVLRYDEQTLTDDEKAQVRENIGGLATESYVNTQISAIPTPDVSGQINTHNVSTSAHNDIRDLISGLTTRLNALADSDDTTLDQMSEVVAYIKSNKSLIDSITTSKVNVADIINNLTTNVSNKPLSAAQGVALKALIDAIVVPTKVSELTNDSGFLSSIPSEYVTESEMQGYAQPKGNYLTSIPSEYVTESELNAKKYLTSFTETDPTVPAWAKAASKPTYTKSEVGLGNVDNVKQYSAENPPPYPVTSVNGNSGDVTVNAVPNSTTSDNGKFLRVVNGAAAWSTVQRAEEVAF